jgi:DNA ligase-1
MRARYTIAAVPMDGMEEARRAASMRGWADIAARVAATTRTSEKRSIIAAYLRDLAPDDLAFAAMFLAGRPLAGTAREPLGLGWRGMQMAVESATGAGEDALRRAYDRTSDPGDALALVIEESGSCGPHGREDPGMPGPGAGETDERGAGIAAGTATDGPSLRDVADTFAAIAATGVAREKADALATLLRRCDAPTARFVVRIVTGELRIGLRDGLLEAAIAEAFDRSPAAVTRARMLTGDVGRTAVLARDDALGTATLDPFRPVGSMLASPAEDAAEIMKRLGPTVWVEDKYDGVRVQLHRRGDEVRLFSRDLNDVTGQFPEVAQAAGPLAWDGILDGEVVAWADGIVLPFLRLQGRLGRKTPSRAVQDAVPVVYVVFDVLAVGPRGGPIAPLLDIPLTERRDRLVGLGLPEVGTGGRFALSHLVSVDSVEGLEREFAAARARRNEGLMVKDPTSPYSPGRRGLGWLKMKKALATLDCVVVGVEVGHGKRHGVLSDWTFAVRDEAHDRLVTIGKAYTGLTDAELAEMTAWFTAHTISTHGRYRVVEPTVVIEIAFDVIQRSPRHRSGFALRFPRITRLRRDKDARDADTLATVEALFTGLQAGAEHLVAGAGVSAAPDAGAAGLPGGAGSRDPGITPPAGPAAPPTRPSRRRAP